MSLWDRLRDSIVYVVVIVGVSTATATYVVTEKYLLNQWAVEIKDLKKENKRLRSRIVDLETAGSRGDERVTTSPEHLNRSCDTERARAEDLERQLTEVKEAQSQNGNAQVTQEQRCPPTAKPECRIQGNALVFSRFAVGTACPTISQNAVIRADAATKKIGLTLSNPNQPMTLLFEEFDPARVTAVQLSFKIHYPKEQTITIWNKNKKISSTIITPHHVVFDGVRHTRKKTGFLPRKTNDIEIKIVEGKVNLLINGQWVAEMPSVSSGIGGVTINGLIQGDYLFAIAGTA